MIPALPGTRANFRHQDADGTYRHIQEPIIAWSDRGTPLVIGGSGKLVSAEIYARFSHTEFRGVDAPSDVHTSVIPGGGWVARFHDGWSTPVVAWGTDGFDYHRPMVMVDDCALIPLGDTEDYELVHPDHHIPEVTAAPSEIGGGDE